MSGLNVLSCGMVTAVGLNAAATCAAMRAGLDGFQETQFIGPGGDWLLGAPVPLPREWIGEKRLAHLAAGALVDALDGQAQALADVQIILCLAEDTRPGRPIRKPEAFVQRMLEYAGLPERTKCHVVQHGRPSGFVALERARRMFKRGETTHALIVGVDSLLSGPAITHYLRLQRLLTPDNANGFIPGEAAAAILCQAGPPTHFAMRGLGLAREAAFLYNPDELPLRADGMTQAYRDALQAAGIPLRSVDYRISDVTGEAFFFKQTVLAMTRLIRGPGSEPDLWTPVDNVGNIGAALVPLMVGWGLTASEKGYNPGNPVLMESSSDDGACAAAIFHSAKRKEMA